jgi:hypothetical protein
MIVAGLLASAFIANPTVRIALAALFAASSVVQLSFEWSTAGPLTYRSFVNLHAATGQLSQALAQHGSVIARAVGAGLLLFAGIALPPRRRRLPLRLGLSVPLLSLGLLSALLFVRGGEGARALPAAYPPLSFAGFLIGETLAADRQPRAAPRWRAPPRR